MLFIREVGQVKFVQENGLFEDILDEDGSVVTSADSLAYEKGARMCIEGAVEAFQVWELQGEYARKTKIEVAHVEG
jgi:hypothetical protein